MTKYYCPYQDCKQIMVQESDFHTDAYHYPMDKNSHTEVFVCCVCGNKVKRSWKWEDAGHEDDDA
jgi:hypothetical protein